MSLLGRCAVLAGCLAGAATTVWWYSHHRQIAEQWESFRIGQAEHFSQAAQLLAQCEQSPDAPSRLASLCAKWGTGNDRFDLYLAEYIGSGKAGEPLREAFSLEFAWREELLPRWAQYWAWKRPQPLEHQLADRIEYFDLLASAEPPRTISWREVLDLQALFTLTGAQKLAVRLKPENWRDRYRQWRTSRPKELPSFVRPEYPFPDWSDPLPPETLLGSPGTQAR